MALTRKYNDKQNMQINKRTVHETKWVYTDLNWDVVVADFMSTGSEFHALDAAT